MKRSVCSSPAARRETLTRDFEPGERTELRDRKGGHVTLYVERLGDVSAGSLFTLAHAHAGHLGELICDPTVVVLRSLDGSWAPFGAAILCSPSLSVPLPHCCLPLTTAPVA
jgi:hypothetical protein